VFLRLAFAALVVRVVLFALLAPSGGAHVLVRLPHVPLPHWLAGLRLGGPVAAEGLLAATYDGLRLGVVLACIGAANSLTSPRRMLKSLPPSLYEAGVALTVAVAFVPQAVTAVGRVRVARRLRGRHDHGWRAIRGVALPVLDGALERSVDLAAAMDARGFGRTGTTPRSVRRATAAVTAVGATAVLASSYGLLDRSAPAETGLPLLVAGVVLVTAATAFGTRRGGRTRYRPDPWRLPEWLTAAAGVTTAVLFVAGVHDGAGTSYAPLAWPPLPPAAVIGVVAALLPGFVTPAVPTPRAAAKPAPQRAAVEAVA
jgi:energy-coupling factor transport system permease protein